ncbi:MAG: hypothetical protein ACK5MV_05980 [Aminipila sp.]
MKRKICLFLVICLLIMVATACNDKNEPKDNNKESAIWSEADKVVKEKIIPQYKKYGLDIVEYEITNVELAAKIPYSGGGGFDFYEVGFKLKPKISKQVAQAEKLYGIKLITDSQGWIVQETKNKGVDDRKLFLSVYSNNDSLCEFRTYKGTDFNQPIKEGKYNNEAFESMVKYIYEEMSQLPIEPEYSFKIDNKSISLGENLKGELFLENTQLERKGTEDLMYILAGYREIQKSNKLSIETYGYFENYYEPVTSMFTENSSVETMRGIKVGDPESKLFEVYGEDNLVFSSESYGGESFNSFAKKENLISEELVCYGYTGDDETQYYIAFFVKDGVVCSIEMGSGMDYKPFKKEVGQYIFQVEDLINEHIDEANIMKYDVKLPRVKETTVGSESLNLIIQNDFERIVAFSENGKFEPMDIGYAYPWVQIEYSVSNVGYVAILNVFSTYSSALGSGADKYLNSYYYDTTCGARMSKEAALYKLGYSKEALEEYFKFKEPELFKTLGKENCKLENIAFYFSKTGEPRVL